MLDRLVGDLSTWVYGLVSGLIVSVIWLLRKVNTNEAQIELLKQEINTREEYRKEKDDEFRSSFAEIRNDIKTLMHK